MTSCPLPLTWEPMCSSFRSYGKPWDVSEFDSYPYRLFYDHVAERGAGLAILVAVALVPVTDPCSPSKQKIQLECIDDLQVLVVLRDSGHRLVAVNVYRRPRQPPAMWEAIQRRLAAVKRGGMDVILVGGDFNETVQLGSGRAVLKCLRPGSCWSFLLVPYPCW